MYKGAFIPLGRLALVTLLLLGFGCRSPKPVEPRTPSENAMSLLDRKLLDIIELEAQLDQIATRPDAQLGEVQRRFQEIDQEYFGLVTRNPENLDVRLLYAKLLSRYGDRDAAWGQFVVAAKLAEKQGVQVPVVHQELSTYYAEDGDHTRAIAYALNAVESSPRTAEYHFQLGQVLAAFKPEFMRDGIYSSVRIDEMMLSAFASAKDLQPDSVDLQLRYGEAFYDVEYPDWEMALAHWQSLPAKVDLSPLQADFVRLHTARCLIGLDRPEEARIIAQSVQSPQLEDSVKVLF
jgi:tetratricopeptide (TPR) repeat protein